MIVYFKKNDNLINNINNFIKIMFSSNVYKIKIIIPIINLGAVIGYNHGKMHRGAFEGKNKLLNISKKT